jgi:hypothetical protein
MSFLAAFSRYVSALAPKFRTKNANVNVDEIDGRRSFKFVRKNFLYLLFGLFNFGKRVSLTFVATQQHLINKSK